jgi:hypothetical protein
MPVYGAKTQFATQDETLPLTGKTVSRHTESHRIRLVLFLYYVRAVDPTIRMPLNDIATEQTKATDKTQVETSALCTLLQLSKS